MKIKAEGFTKQTASGYKFRELTKRCPYPAQCTWLFVPKVGSFSCHNCGMCKGWSNGFVYCRAGDKIKSNGKDDGSYDRNKTA